MTAANEIGVLHEEFLHTLNATTKARLVMVGEIPSSHRPAVSARAGLNCNGQVATD